MNSFRYLERGVEAEIARQTADRRGGGTVEQETLHFDPADGTLTPLRSKEYAHDYRYFPEPDLVPLAPSAAEQIEAARAALPELPERRRERYVAELGLNRDAARLLAFDADLADFFEAALRRRCRGRADRDCQLGDRRPGRDRPRGRSRSRPTDGGDRRGRRDAGRARRRQAGQPQRGA